MPADLERSAGQKKGAYGAGRWWAGRGAWIEMGVTITFLLFFLCVAAATADTSPWYPVQNLTAYTSVNDATPDANGRLFVAGATPSDQARLFFLGNGSEMGLSNGSYAPRAIVASDTGLVCFGARVGSQSHVVTIMNWSTGALVARFATSSQAEIDALAWVDSSRIVVGDSSGNISLYSTAGAPLMTYRESQGGGVKFLSISGDRRYLAGGSVGMVGIWRVADGSPVFNVSNLYVSYLDGVFLDDEDGFVFIDTDSNVRWVDLFNFSEFKSLRIGSQVQSIAYQANGSLLLLGDNYPPYLRAVFAETGSIAWTDARIAYRVSRVRTSPDSQWFITASQVSGAISIWATRAEPWNPAPPPPELIPLVAVSSPAPGGIYQGMLNVSGNSQPPGAAIRVLISFDNSSTLVATGTDTWFLPIDLRLLGEGYHEVQVWGIGTTLVGPPIRVGFYAVIPPDTRLGPLELGVTTPMNGSTVLQVGAVAGTIANATNGTTVFVQVANGTWFAAPIGAQNWFAYVNPPYLVAGIAAIAVSAFDRDGRTAWVEYFVMVSGNVTSVSELEVVILAPAEGSVVNGSFVVSGLVLNGTGTILTQVELNGTPLKAFSFERNWSVNISIEGAAAGFHHLWVQAVDSEGRVAFAGRRIMVSQSTGGPAVNQSQGPPNVSIVYPTGGMLVDQVFVAVGGCSNCSTGFRLVFYLDSVEISSFPADEYWRANVSSAKAGAHVLRVELMDGQIVQARDEVTVNIRSQVTISPPGDSSWALLLALGLGAALVVTLWRRKPNRQSLAQGHEEEPDGRRRPRSPGR